MILLALAILTRSSWGQTGPNVGVTAEPERKSFVEGSDLSFRFSITNNSEQSISFSTCPPPYDVALSDSQDRPVPQSDHYIQQSRKGNYVCESTVEIEIKPGETWGPQVWPTPDRGMFDLKAGTYIGRLLWHFTIYEKESAGGVPALKHIRYITTPSTVFTFAVIPRP